MKVILKEDVSSLGKAGDVVTVSDGYARNYLIPKQRALEANAKNIKALDREKELIERRVDTDRVRAEETAQRIHGLTVTLQRKVGEQQKLFVSVTSRDIEEALAAEGIAVDRKLIILDEPIKEPGDFQVKIKLMRGVVAELNLSVVGEH